MTEFLSKDPAKAIVEIKEKLYSQLQIVNGRIEQNKRERKGFIDDYDNVELNIEINCWQGEAEFLKNILDIIERS